MDFNATAAAAAHETAQRLYAHVDLSKLGWLEQLWASWYIWIDNPIIATGLMSFLLHEIVYFGRCVPWIIIDAIPYFQKWKLQPNKVPTAAEQWECTKQVLFSHFTIELPAVNLVVPSHGRNVGDANLPSTLPTLGRPCSHKLPSSSCLKTCSTTLLTKPFTGEYCTSMFTRFHHKYSAPFGLAAEYAHPAEVFILGTGTIAGPILYCSLTRNLHIFTVYVWITLRLFQAIDAHSGYDFPWSLQHIVPFWSGAEHHDFHHMAFTNNFSTSFRWCDRLFGTDDKYREYRRRIAANKAAMKGKSKAEQDAAERQLIAEIEAEGHRAEAIAEGSVQQGKTVKVQ
ncbi:hypothetical protein J3R82DRAFT_7645 [Butyriboletus roseoflavus]|nr:hypothetical protein J3R82DRAFT_7645 [Butyriboletus roseoflavus]